MHSTIVIATTTKLSTLLLYTPRKVDVGLKPLFGVWEGGLGGISPRSSDTSVLTNGESHRHQTFHPTSLGPEEGRREVTSTGLGGGKRAGWSSPCSCYKECFRFSDSYHYQTFYTTYLGPKEVRCRVETSILGEGNWVNFTHTFRHAW